MLLVRGPYLLSAAVVFLLPSWDKGQSSEGHPQCPDDQKQAFFPLLATSVTGERRTGEPRQMLVEDQARVRGEFSF